MCLKNREESQNGDWVSDVTVCASPCTFALAPWKYLIRAWLIVCTCDSGTPYFVCPEGSLSICEAAFVLPIFALLVLPASLLVFVVTSFVSLFVQFPCCLVNGIFDPCSLCKKEFIELRENPEDIDPVIYIPGECCDMEWVNHDFRKVIDYKEDRISNTSTTTLSTIATIKGCPLSCRAWALSHSETQVQRFLLSGRFRQLNDNLCCGCCTKSQEVQSDLDRLFLGSDIETSVRTIQVVAASFLEQTNAHQLPSCTTTSPSFDPPSSTRSPSESNEMPHEDSRL